ncbi:hypothetical protein DY000_02050608 [Brassica cretica]|uniref:Secreted protein n=1 Tax=Brassica cretica TaxID=69181 RepID=A0ABQ7ENC7_BRACR|nr:hypothetical protein DY000_02050608 [Brassica cretica]
MLSLTLLQVLSILGSRCGCLLVPDFCFSVLVLGAPMVSMSRVAAVVGDCIEVGAFFLWYVRYFHSSIVSERLPVEKVISIEEITGIQLLRRQQRESRHPRQRGKPHFPMVILEG